MTFTGKFWVHLKSLSTILQFRNGFGKTPYSAEGEWQKALFPSDGRAGEGWTSCALCRARERASECHFFPPPLPSNFNFWFPPQRHSGGRSEASGRSNACSVFAPNLFSPLDDACQCHAASFGVRYHSYVKSAKLMGFSTLRPFRMGPTTDTILITWS